MLEFTRLVSSARPVPQRSGFDLVRIDSAAENAFVKANTLSYASVWIGANDRGTERTWKWSSNDDTFWQGATAASGGHTVGGRYASWSSSEPASSGNSFDCGALYPWLAGLWGGASCSVAVPYVCEMQAVSDADCDGADDRLEALHGLNPANPADGKADPDGDGIPSGEELLLGGNPGNANTDGDSEPDGTDLARGLDLDGDGWPSELDNCDTVANISLHDANFDGIGDACDENPLNAGPVSYVSLHLAQHVTRRDFVLRNAGSNDPDRLSGDLNGYLDTGTTFIAFQDPGSGYIGVTELVHPTTGRHAYAKTAAEITTWQGRGFVSRGIAFAVATSAPSFGDPALVRRFERGGAVYEQTVTMASADAVVLLAAGYVEVSSLGWGLYDEGRVRSPKPVVRYRRASDGATLHSMMPDAELSLVGYDSDGKKFRLLPEPNGWTLPLLRLRNAAGFEALSTSLSDAFALQGQGYALEGIAGWLYYDDASVDTLDDLALLVRLKKNGRYAHSADRA